MKQVLLNTLLSMSNADLYEAMFIDPVTKTLNRVAFDKCSPYAAIAIVDLDSLKYINDTSGHREGDRYLRYLGEKLVAHLGRDNVYRLSGDEFVVTGDTCAELETVLSDLQELYLIFSFGVHTDLGYADQNLTQNKQARETTKARAARGEKPSWYGKIFKQ